MAARPLCACATLALLLTSLSVLVSLPPRAAAASNTWTTDADFNQAGATFTGTEVVGSGVDARVDLIKDNTDWSDMAPTTAPGPREGPGLAFSSDDGVSVLFGGYGGDDWTDTWEYDYAANAWTEVPGAGPSGRESPGFSYDPVEKVAVLFGGMNSTDGFLNDTWEYDVAADTWSEQSPSTSPPPLADYALTYYASAARHVVFGRELVTGQMQTWAYDAAAHAWSDLNPGASPSTRSAFAVAYHAARDRLVLFGGSWFTTFFAETWEYEYGGSWAQVGVSGPSARAGHAMTYRPASASVLLFGGLGPTGWSQETWRYTAFQAWILINPGTRPSPRQIPGFTYDTADDVAILFGGRSSSGTPLGDTWAFVAAYRAAGKYASAVFDGGAANVDWGTIAWNKTPANQPANTFLRFQLAAADSPSGPFSFVGPDGTVTSYYTSPGTAIWAGLDGHEYLRFLGDFGTTDTDVTPNLEDLTIGYDVPPAPPYVVFTDPADGTFDVPLGKVLHVTFSKPVEPSTLAVTWLLGDAVPLVPSWSNGDRDVDLTHAEPFEENRVYRLLVSVKDLLGQDLVPGPVPNPWVFSTEKDFPVVRNTNPIHDQSRVPESFPVFVNFSEPMNTTSVTVSITPDLSLDRVWSNGNASLRLDHPIRFEQCTHYAVEVNGTDAADLPLVPGPTANPWTFLVACRDPYLEFVSPANRQVDVPFDAPVVVVFSEPMNVTTVTFNLEPQVAGESLSWSDGDTRLTMTHTAPFVTCVIYTITVAGRDADEGRALVPNPFQPEVYANPSKFAPVCSRPFIYATYPAANETNVSVGREVRVVFNPMVGIDPTTVTWTATGGPFLVWNVTWDTAFDPPLYWGVHLQHLGFRQCSRYTFLIDGSAGGAPLVPGFAPNPWSFDIECYSPYVVTTDPPNGTTQVPLDAPVVVRFSEPMNTTSVVFSAMPAVAFDPAWSDNNTTLTLTHAGNYTGCTRYDVFVDGLGEDGNSLLVGEWSPASADPWMFKSWCPGFYINRTEPADGVTGVDYGASITVEFSRSADPTTFQVTISPPVPFSGAWSDNDTIVVLDPEVPLEECAWYTVTVSAKDAFGGNELINTTISAPNPWRFRTRCILPEITATDPADGAVDVPLDAAIVVEFSEPMLVASVNVTIAPAFPLASSWTNNDTILTLTHGATFVPLQTYCVTVAGTDLHGNPLVPGPAPNPWCFTTAPPIAAPRGLQVIRAPPDVALTWMPVPRAVVYVVYESGDRLAPWPWVELGSTTTTSFTAAGHGSDGLPHYYVVRARAGPAIESSNSTMGAKVSLSFFYDPGRTNVYWLGLPYRSMYRTASDISDELTASRIDVVGKWDPATERSVLWYYFRGQWRGTDFPLEPGAGFYLGVRSAFTWVVNGTDAEVTLSFTPYSWQTMYWIALPYTSPYKTASDIVLELEGSGGGARIVEVGTWDPVRERVLAYYWDGGAWRGDDFATAPGLGLYLKVVRPFTWSPKLLTPAVP